VKHEGPIKLELAARRVAGHWGLQRVTRRAVERVSQMLSGLPVRVLSDSGGTFLWQSDADPATYALFRVPGDDAETVRDASDLPPEEIGNAVLYLLRQHISAPEEDLIREAGRTLGFRRTGRQVEERVRRVIDNMVRAGRVSRNGSIIALTDR
jgi:hypothetical protein